MKNIHQVASKVRVEGSSKTLPQRAELQKGFLRRIRKGKIIIGG